jgi:hypothetical protein
VGHIGDAFPKEKSMHKFKLSLIGPSLLLGIALLFALALRTGARQTTQSKKSADAASHGLQFSGEKHLANIRQLTFGGQSAEAYFSADDKYLTFQHQGQFFDPATHSAVGPTIPCDQIFTIPVDMRNGQAPTPKMLSNGKGRTTCSYFFPSGDRMLYSSTFAANPTRSTPQSLTAATFARLPRRTAITRNPPSRAMASTSFSLPRVTATSMSSPWMPTAQT